MAERAAALLPEDLPAVRRVRPDLLHLTLAFIGNVAPERQDGIASALRPAVRAQPALRLRLDGLGQFPPSGRPRSVWVGVSGPTGARLVGLAGAVRDALAGASVPFDGKPFRAHVTLGRVVATATSADAAAIRKVLRREIVPIALSADDVALVQSVLSPKGPSYTSIARFPLEGYAARSPRQRRSGAATTPVRR